MKTYQVKEFDGRCRKALTTELTSRSRAYNLRDAFRERRETRVYVKIIKN